MSNDADDDVGQFSRDKPNRFYGNPSKTGEGIENHHHAQASQGGRRTLQLPHSPFSHHFIGQLPKLVLVQIVLVEKMVPALPAQREVTMMLV